MTVAGISWILASIYGLSNLDRVCVAAPSISGCVSVTMKATKALQGVILLEGSSSRCFMRLGSNGTVTIAAWCRARLPQLTRVTTWSGDIQDVVLIDAEGAEFLRLKPGAQAGVLRGTLASGEVFLFYPMMPEASPH